MIQYLSYVHCIIHRGTYSALLWSRLTTTCLQISNPQICYVTPLESFGLLSVDSVNYTPKIRIFPQNTL